MLVTVDAVRGEAVRLGSPYLHSDAEVQAAIDAERERWATFRRQLAATLPTKHGVPSEPIPEEWIFDGAARRVWDDMRLPFVFLRAEAYEARRAQRSIA